jgi:hypothetical protein
VYDVPIAVHGQSLACSFAVRAGHRDLPRLRKSVSTNLDPFISWWFGIGLIVVKTLRVEDPARARIALMRVVDDKAPARRPVHVLHGF